MGEMSILTLHIGVRVCVCGVVCVNEENIHPYSSLCHKSFLTCSLHHACCPLIHSGDTSDSDGEGKTKGSSKEGYGSQRVAGLGLAGGPSSSVSTNTPPGLLTGPSRRRPRSRRCVSEMLIVLATASLLSILLRMEVLWSERVSP